MKGLLLAAACLGMVVPGVGALADEPAKAPPASSPTKAAPICQPEAQAHAQTRTREALLALADCNDKAGKVATAWRLFDTLAAEARAAGDAEQETRARDRVSVLERRLPKLRVDVVGTVADVRVEVDGVVIDPKRYGVAEPIDPGDHVVRVLRGDASLASGVLASRDIVLVEMGRETASFDVDELTRAQAQPKPVPAAPVPNVTNQMPADLEGKASKSPFGWMRPVGYTAIAVGTVAGLTFLGLELSALALSGNADCTTLRDDTSACTQGGFDQLDTARSLAEAGQWTGVGAAIVLTMGIVFVAAAPADAAAPSPPQAWVIPTFGQGFGLVVGGTL